jgi:hypothetical protein
MNPPLVDERFTVERRPVKGTEIIVRHGDAPA